MNTIDTILNWNPLLTEGQVKKRVLNKVLNKYNDTIDTDQVPGRHRSIMDKTLSSKKGRAKLMNSGHSRKTKNQLLRSGQVNPKNVEKDINAFIDHDLY